MELVCKDVSFAYHRKQVLHNVGLTLKQGEVLCVLGPNGVGKSTLFRCLLGLRNNYGGSILLGGQEIRELKPRETARRIAYIPQTSAPVFSYSVFNAVLMGTTSQVSATGTPGKEQEQSAMEALEKMGITHLKDRKAGSLSGGEQQMVGIARALAQNSPLLVMDEPTASLDYGNTIRVMELIRGLADQGYGVILSTHDPDLVLRYATKVLILENGTVRSFGVPEEAMTSQLLTEVYGVPIEIASITVDNTLHRVCVPVGNTSI